MRRGISLRQAVVRTGTTEDGWPTYKAGRKKSYFYGVRIPNRLARRFGRIHWQ